MDKRLTDDQIAVLKQGLSVLSLGWGVQSWAMVAMACLGDLPVPDMCIHSDTTWERSTTYRFSEFWEPWVRSCGVRIETTADPNYAKRVTDPTKGLYIPGYTLAADPPHKKGQLLRSCTDKWKISPLRRVISAELKSRGLKKSAGAATVWLGISMDEFMRAKHSPVKYIVHQYPLLDLGVTRTDCDTYLKTTFVRRAGLEYALDMLPSMAGVSPDSVNLYLSRLSEGHLPYDYLNVVVPGKSSCTFCPYHSAAVWLDMKRECDNGFKSQRVAAAIRYDPVLEICRTELETLAEFTVGDPNADWQQAVSVDAAVRDKRPGFKTFVHTHRIPLSEVDSTEDDGRNPEDDATCDSGYCFM